MARLRLVLIIGFVVLGAGLSLWVWFRTAMPERIQERASNAQSRYREVRNRPDVVQGEIDATQFNVAAKIAGRVITFLVSEGQMVRQGDPLLEIDSPELQAKREQAQAAQDQASAMQEKAESGARPEEIEQARLHWYRATAPDHLAMITCALF